MPFEIKTPTAATLTSVTPRKEMHGDEPVSAVSLGLTLTGPNTLLDHLDGGALRNALYMAVPGQDQLPGVEPATPLLRCKGIDQAALKGKLEGWTVKFEHGIDDDSAIVLGSSRVDKFRVKPMEGGSVELLFRVGTSDINEEEAGALFGKLGQEVMLTLKAPAMATAPVIDGSVDAFKKDHPDAGDDDGQGDLLSGGDDDAAGQDTRDAGDVFAAAHGNSSIEDDDHGPGAGDSDSTAGTQQAGDDLAELEAGMAASMQAAGVGPKGRRTRKTTAGAME